MKIVGIRKMFNRGEEPSRFFIKVLIKEEYNYFLSKRSFGVFSIIKRVDKDGYDNYDNYDKLSMGYNVFIDREYDVLYPLIKKFTRLEKLEQLRELKY